MLIIKIIIIYFIQIRHTDDFPSAVIPASSYNNSNNKKMTYDNNMKTCVCVATSEYYYCKHTTVLQSAE